MELTNEQINEAVNKINNKEATRKEMGESLGVSNTTLSRRIKEAGYEFDQKTKKYILTSPNPESQKENKQDNKKANKKESNPTNKQGKQETKKPKQQKESKEEIQEVRKPKKVTYEIDENLHYELRITAFRRKINVSELVEAAIRQYLSDEK